MAFRNNGVRNLWLGSILLLSAGTLRGEGFTIVDPHELGSVILGEASANGNGCSQGSTFQYLDTYTQELLLFFDDYMAEVGGFRRIDRKNCSLAIPIHLPKGIRVVLVATRYEGFNILSDGASTVLSSEAFIAGSESEVLQTRFEGALDENFVVENASVLGKEQFSPCGGDVTLRINSSLRLKANRYGDPALAAITALGASASPVVQRLRFVRCG